MADQLTDADIAKAWRAKYPGAYDDMDDAAIAAGIRAKRPDFITELQPHKTYGKAAAYRQLFEPLFPNQTANIADTIQGSSENPAIASARGFVAGSAKSVMDAASSPIGIMASLLGPEIAQLVGRAGEMGPTVQEAVPYVGHKLGNALDAFSRYKPVTDPFAPFKFLADRLKGLSPAREAELMLDRASSAAPAAPGASIAPGRDLYPLFKAGEAPVPNAAGAPRLVKQPPNVSQVIQDALEQARQPGSPSIVTGAPEPSITPAGREGNFQSSGRPGVTERRYDELLKKNGGGSPPPSPTSPGVSADVLDRAASKQGMGQQTEAAHQAFADMMARKGAKVEGTGTTPSTTPAQMYRVAGYNTDRQVEQAIADGDYDEAGRIMARGLDNFFGGSVAKWTTSGKTPAIAAALAEGLRRQLGPLVESDSFQQADADKQAAMVRRAMNNPQRRRALMQAVGGR